LAWHCGHSLAGSFTNMPQAGQKILGPEPGVGSAGNSFAVAALAKFFLGLVSVLLGVMDNNHHQIYLRIDAKKIASNLQVRRGRIISRRNGLKFSKTEPKIFPGHPKFSKPQGGSNQGQGGRAFN
jgi:hypothetical protein